MPTAVLLKICGATFTMFLPWAACDVSEPPLEKTTTCNATTTDALASTSLHTTAQKAATTERDQPSSTPNQLTVRNSTASDSPIKIATSTTTLPDASTSAPQRIVTIAPNAAEMIAALGAADRIVGVSTFCVFPPALTQRPRVGGLMDPNLEKMVDLKPDLLVLRGSMPTVEKLAQKLNIPIYRDQTESLDDIYTTINELGQLLNRQAAAETLIAQLRADLVNATAHLKGHPRPTVLFVVSRDPGGIRNIVTVGKKPFVTELIRLAGGRGALEHSSVDYPQLNAEALVATKPDVIIEVVMPDTTDSQRQAMLDHWRSLGDALPAYRNKRIHILTDDYLLIPSPRVLQSVRKLIEIIHPTESTTP